MIYMSLVSRLLPTLRLLIHDDDAEYSYRVRNKQDPTASMSIYGLTRGRMLFETCVMGNEVKLIQVPRVAMPKHQRGLCSRCRECGRGSFIGLLTSERPYHWQSVTRLADTVGKGMRCVRLIDLLRDQI